MSRLARLAALVRENIVESTPPDARPAHAPEAAKSAKLASARHIRRLPTDAADPADPAEAPEDISFTMAPTPADPTDPTPRAETRGRPLNAPQAPALPRGCGKRITPEPALPPAAPAIESYQPPAKPLPPSKFNAMTQPRIELSVADIARPYTGLPKGMPVPHPDAPLDAEVQPNTRPSTLMTGAVVWGRQRSRMTKLRGGLGPTTIARHEWFERHADDIYAFARMRSREKVVRQQMMSNLNEPSRGVIGWEEFLAGLLDEHGAELLTIKDMVDMPPEFQIRVDELGTFHGLLMDLQRWARLTTVPLTVAEVAASQPHEVEELWQGLLDAIADAEMIPSIAQMWGCTTTDLSAFVAAYTSKTKGARAKLMDAVDRGLEYLTTKTADDIDRRLSSGVKLTNGEYLAAQSKLNNFRTLVLRLTGSNYAAPAAQALTVKADALAGGTMQINLTYKQPAPSLSDSTDNDVIDVFAYAPKAIP
jgi:hypothetical protein